MDNKTIKEYIIKNNVFSVFSLYYGTKKIIENCHGFRDIEKQFVNNENTLFGIASGTKFFTALGIMKLEEEGKLQITDYVKDYVTFPKEYDENITIKQLLSHTSGIPDYFDEDEIEDFDNFTVDVPWNQLEKPSDYLKVLPVKKMKFKPGTNFHYNNSGFVLLSIIIEKVTGDFHTYIEQVILRPLGMKLSGFYRFDALPPNTAIGYKNIDQPPYKNNQETLPIIGAGDGGMYTTLNEMKMFWSRLFEGVVLNIETVKRMMKPVHLSDKLSYGLGVWLARDEHQYNPILIGEDSGVSFESGYNDKTKRSYTIISNTQDGVWGISKRLREM